ncbi:alpha/beta hydrolase family protein [Cellulomonas gilvus]|uniref:Hydrolase of the alpha/beta-hydrolase fold family n=1 Tax=Cellulomonas gilvus (strain ATCC 13127 / NRRL B-14078) TaxID=593907 RepID=F8A571_CELGA|nr:alpha/beta family hydrolase [Cellulomonas gilvus]AEI13315.1 hydrolase of the alpha/beta-hydrolase fold family [Cellulomonas gilvus ATCC 13127]
MADALTHPDPARVAGVVLTPGAGADRDHPTLRALEEALAPLPVLRLNFPNRDRGKAGPERAEVAIPFLHERVTQWADELGVGTDRIVVGGRSFGGRMSSIAVAQGLHVAGLLLLSYPLHPPGRPDDLRIDHLPQVSVPVLAVSGATDPYGSPDELARHLATITGPLSLVTVPGTHGPPDAPVVAAVTAWLGR